MRIITKTKNLALTEELRNFIEEKIIGLKKFVDVLKEDIGTGKTLAEVFVEVEKETLHHKKGKIFLIKARIRLPSKTLIAFAKKDDLGAAIVEVKDKLQREIKKYKFKTTGSRRRKQREFKKSLLTTGFRNKK